MQCIKMHKKRLLKALMAMKGEGEQWTDGSGMDKP